MSESSQQIACYEFQNTGECSFGAKCMFAHIDNFPRAASQTSPDVCLEAQVESLTLQSTKNQQSGNNERKEKKKTHSKSSSKSHASQPARESNPPRASKSRSNEAQKHHHSVATSHQSNTKPGTTSKKNHPETQASRASQKTRSSGSTECPSPQRPKQHPPSIGSQSENASKRKPRPKSEKTSKPRSSRHRVDTDDPIVQFFARFRSFTYDPHKAPTAQFYAMCDRFGWDRDDLIRKKVAEQFKEALVMRFNKIYGTDVNDIENWHRLCLEIGIEPLPEDLEKCREVIRETHVNLVDLVDPTVDDVEVFGTLEELQDYTIHSGKYFPKKSARAGGVLKFLLREIINSYFLSWHD